MNLELKISEKLVKAVKKLYSHEIAFDEIQIQRTRKDFRGDYTVVVFPLLRYSKKPPEQTGEEIGAYLKDYIEEISDFNVIKGFLNLTISNKFWITFLNSIHTQDKIYSFYFSDTYEKFVVEFSSPNTNKPLHLGHIRNNLLGFSISRIFEAAGKEVAKVNLVNDRGIHICKSMVAWAKWGKGETPEKKGVKGDHLVGDYYVKFDKAYKEQVRELIEQGVDKEKAEKEAPLMKEAREMLNKWEKDDKEVVSLWEKMNSWVLEGFNSTYKKLDVNFDKEYFESEIYKKGKQEILRGLNEGIFLKKSDGSVWANFEEEDLDMKLLLRSDGTSVYITQDVGTAIQRYQDFNFDKQIYVVGNEQNYHFQVLKLLLHKLGYEWAENLYHLSYGMVELPEGKMKSREGTVVDADDLIDEMIETAEEMSEDVGKIHELPEDERGKIYKQVGLAALKYFILKVNPKKNMTFDPKESIDFNGNTGPFIQYTYARINSLKEKAKKSDLNTPQTVDSEINLNNKEVQLIKLIHKFPSVINEAAEEMDPSIVANHVYETAKEYNQFYHDYSVIKADTFKKAELRLLLSIQVSKVIEEGMWLLGIDMPYRM
ncbi:MAG: arginine--tRNA ligase [Bacteroidales bacterium]